MDWTVGGRAHAENEGKPIWASPHGPRRHRSRSTMASATVGRWSRYTASWTREHNTGTAYKCRRAGHSGDRVPVSPSGTSRDRVQVPPSGTSRDRVQVPPSRTSRDRASSAVSECLELHLPPALHCHCRAKGEKCEIRHDPTLFSFASHDLDAREHKEKKP